MAANGAHQMTWCCILKLCCINSGEAQYVSAAQCGH
jgi:hypothetical protein